MTARGTDQTSTPGRLVGWGGSSLLPFALGLLTILSATALLFAPVDQSHVQVTWPATGQPRESTALLLTNQTPHLLAVEISADSAVAGLPHSAGTVFATIDPSNPDAPTKGLVVSVRDGILDVASNGLNATGSPTGTWRIQSSIAGTLVTQDGRTIAQWNVPPPQIDGLLTDVAASSGGLSAQIQAVDDVHDRPTFLKMSILIVGLLALALTLAAIWRDDRRSSGESATRVKSRFKPARFVVMRWVMSLGVADLLVVGALALWSFIGPMTDDDGYYATMGMNAGGAGYVGNYFQMFNQTFTPFTWLWWFFGFWQDVGGRSPVWLRLPALVLAVVAWFLTRALLDSMRVMGRRSVTEGVHLFLGAVFVTWWAAYAMGARPEPIVATATIAVIWLMLASFRRCTLLPGAIGVAVAALSFAAHPVGIVSAAPLLLSMPMLWKIARGRGSLGAAVGRTVAVAAASVVALMAAFATGSLYDLQSAQLRFSLVERPLDWTNEISRYALLFGDFAMGSYAKRVVVLIGLVLLIWFLVYTVWSRNVGVFSTSMPFALIGWSFGLSFILMWITTSKWTHHFGSIAALGPLFIAAMCTVVPRLIEERLPEGRRVAPWLAPVVVASLIPVTVIALRGPDTWAYEWGEALRPVAAPRLLGIGLGNIFVWIAGAIVLLALAGWWSQRTNGSWRTAVTLRAASAFVAIVFAVTSVYMLSSFVRIVAPGAGFTPNRAALQDPSGSQCLPDRAIRLWDAAQGRSIPISDPSGASVDAFTLGMVASPPKGAESLPMWASQSSAAGGFTSGWYRAPELQPTQRLGVLTSGDLRAAGAMRLWVETRANSGKITRTAVQDSAARPGWSTLLLTLSPGSNFRLVAQDSSTLEGADLTVSDPVVIDEQRMSDLATPGAPTAISWMQSWWFPCDRPMTIADGVIEPPVFATTFGPNGVDNIWVNDRGGSLAGVKRLAVVNTPATGLGSTADSSWGRVHLLEYRVALAAYDLQQTWVSTPGWRSSLEPASQIVFPGG